MSVRRLLRASTGSPQGASRSGRERSPSLPSRSPGFVLLEVMLAVMIFSLGILSLGACVSNCLMAERLKEEDVRVGRMLANRMAEIEAQSIQLGDSTTEELKGMCEGMTLKTTRTPVKKKNEKGQDITNLFLVTLTLNWESDHQKQSRELMFYVHPKRR